MNNENNSSCRDHCGCHGSPIAAQAPDRAQLARYGSMSCLW
jgi:hypothetical protein